MIRPLFALVAVITSLALSQAQPSETFDVLIQNGRVMDGSGNPWIRADIGIRGGLIAARSASARRPRSPRDRRGGSAHHTRIHRRPLTCGRRTEPRTVAPGAAADCAGSDHSRCQPRWWRPRGSCRAARGAGERGPRAERRAADRPRQRPSCGDGVGEPRSDG